MAAKSVLGINQEQLAFYWMLGQAITQWSHVEHAIAQIAFRAFGSDRDSWAILGGAFYSIENFRSKLAFVDRAMENATHLQKFYSEWVEMRDEVRSASSRRNQLAHSRVMIYLSAPEGRRIAIVPLFGPAPGKRHNPDHPPPGSICVRDIDLIRLRSSKAFARLQGLYFRMNGQEDPLAEFAQRELRPQTLAQLRRQIQLMCEQQD